MARARKIPVLEVSRLNGPTPGEGGLLADRLENYVGRHYLDLQHIHGHSDYHIVLFTSGSGSHEIDFQQFAVRPGQMYFMIPGQVHSWNFPGKVTGFVLNFPAEFFAGFLHNPGYLDQFFFLSGVSADCVVQLDTDAAGHAGTIMAEVCRSRPDTQLGRDRQRILVLQLFMAVQDAAGERIAGINQSVHVQLMTEFRRLIQQHYQQWRLPKEYARQLHVTPNHLNAVCREILGKPAGEVIRDRVLVAVKRLLINRTLQISAIADQLGFQDQSYLSRFFKKYSGLSPEEFRREQMAATSKNASS